jgi:hypothetical protein
MPTQMSFELHGLILALHYEARFLKTDKSLDRAKRGFEHILLRYGATLHHCKAVTTMPSYTPPLARYAICDE